MNIQQNNKQGAISRMSMVIYTVVVILVTAAVIVIYNSKTSVNSFQECRDKGGEVTIDEKTHKSSCRLKNKIFDKMTHQGGDKSDSADEQKYIGLKEDEALEQAEEDGKSARVVERDGESLTVTMDLRQGRLNFTVEDGKVTGVTVE